jgi:asparagine synthase (glutamine-hydrolysing)
LKAAFVQGIWPVLPDSVRSVMRRVRGRTDAPLYLTPEFVQRSGLHDRQRAPGGRQCVTRSQQEIYDWLGHGGLTDCNEMEDRHHAEFGIEPRHPFHDRRVIEFAFAIPEEQRWRFEQTKFVLRQAMRGLLPEDVRTRTTKGDYSSMLVEALEASGGEGCFASLELARRGWVRSEPLVDMYRRMRARFTRRDPLYATDTLALWSVYSVELWLRHAGD